MTFQPGVYKCAVAICPISVVGAANKVGGFGGSPLIANYWSQVFGENVSTNKDATMKASPLIHVSEISDGASIMICHGENDPRVPVNHSYRAVDELKKRISLGGDMLLFANEGHGLSKEVAFLMRQVWNGS
jgi:dipeptidyl aminopeptidase/acylaminoacyl peptidase